MSSNRIKIAVISHALTVPVFQNRWKRLALDQNEVHNYSSLLGFELVW